MMDKTGLPESSNMVSTTRMRSINALDFRKAIVLIRKHKWTIMLVTITVTALSALAISLLSPVYRSTVTVLFGDEKSDTGFERMVESSSRQRGKTVETQIEILISRSFTERVVDDMKLTKHWEYNDTLSVPVGLNSYSPIGSILSRTLMQKLRTTMPNNRQNIPAEEIRSQAVSLLMRNVRVVSIKNTDLVKLSVDSHDRLLAPEIANRYAKALKEFYLERSTTRDTQEKIFLDRKLDKLKKNLDLSEQELLSERKRVGLSFGGRDSSSQTISILSNRLIDAKGELELLQIQWDQILSIKQSKQTEVANYGGVKIGGSLGVKENQYEFLGSAYSNLPIVDSNSVVQQNKRLVQEALRKVNELNNRYGVKHPRVIDAQSNLLTLSNNLDRQIRNVISSVENEYRVAQRQVSTIKGEINREESKELERNSGRVFVQGIELERDSHKRFYEDALRELQSYQERDLESVPISVSDYAVAATSPVSPRKNLFLLMAFVLSAFLISSMMFFFESLRDSVQGIGQIERELNLPVFGILPMVRRKLFSNGLDPLIPGKFEDREGAFAEAVWTIRTSATDVEFEESNKVIAVTSSVPGEGKSTLAANLACALAELESVVLLVADLRRPGIDRALGIRRSGLHEILVGENGIEESIITNSIASLDVIPAGRPVRSPGKLLASPEFSRLISSLTDRYDRVVIDLAPVQAVSDALVVGKYADTLIYVVKAESTPLPVVSRGIKRLRDKGIEVGGVVISQVDFVKISSYGGDYYYQGYYDHYGLADPSSMNNRGRLRYPKLKNRNNGRLLDHRSRRMEVPG